MSKLALKIQALRGWRRPLVAVLAGGLAATALPPLAFWPTVFIAFPILALLLDGVSAGSDRLSSRMGTSFVIGWAFGFGYFGVSLYWIGQAFLVDAETFAWLMPFAVTAMPAGLGLFWGLAAMLAITVWSNGAGRVFILAASFAVLEWVRGHILTGFPWNAPAYAADAVLPIAQSASLIGLYGLCFLIVLWATAPVLLVQGFNTRGRLASLIVIVVSVVSAAAFGVWRLEHSQAAFQPGIELRVLQPNIAQKDKWQPDNRRWIYRRYLEMTRSDETNQSLRLIIWPESALPALLDEQPDTRQQIATAAGDNSLIILGSLRRHPAKQDSAISNSVLVIGDEGKIAGRYDKQKLVPFGEYLPLANFFEPLGLRKLVALPSGFISGPGPSTIRVDGVPAFSPLICYEAIFPRDMISRTDRPDWLVNVTNDAWFGDSAGPYQHLAQARLRAIEEGLPLIRSANTGISAVIDPRGRILHHIELSQQGVIDAKLPVPARITIYALYGDWLFLILILSAVLLPCTDFFLQNRLKYKKI